MHIRRLTPIDASIYQALRLAALKELPTAYGSSYDEEKDAPMTVVEGILAHRPDRGTFGAFRASQLVGLVSVAREAQHNTAHKGLVWGMYVRPDQRGQGLGRELLLKAIAHARSMPGLLQVNLAVGATNLPALRLYESVGFRAFGVEAGAMLVQGETVDEILMQLRLVAPESAHS
ncbi:N-acetyltransferase family protein [Ramlibacter sp. MMS24-I3-19]|uniref:GNAT family N-acetyltransferase n=1 Tax=Ramlibacter sp. MMS24-I3-19 TaxID=3416606 RepID=UPI003D05751A